MRQLNSVVTCVMRQLNCHKKNKTLIQSCDNTKDSCIRNRPTYNDVIIPSKWCLLFWLASWPFLTTIERDIQTLLDKWATDNCHEWDENINLLYTHTKNECRYRLLNMHMLLTFIPGNSLGVSTNPKVILLGLHMPTISSISLFYKQIYHHLSLEKQPN